MQSGCEYELEYLRGLVGKFGSHYLGRYFGFTLKDMANYIGISRSEMSYILCGKRKMQDKYIPRFLEAFKHFDIEAKSKDFKESKMDLLGKTLNLKLKLDKMAVLLIIMTTMINSSFLKTSGVNFPQYIVELWGDLARNIHSTLRVAVTVIVTSTLIFLSKTAHFFYIKRTVHECAFFVA